jgi:hypothetical protein
MTLGSSGVVLFRAVRERRRLPTYVRLPSAAPTPPYCKFYSTIKAIVAISHVAIYEGRSIPANKLANSKNSPSRDLIDPAPNRNSPVPLALSTKSN